jgi:TDG/mug DNA glycosylase family protein
VTARQPVPDVLAPNLDVLFCGINPGLYSAAVGHNFARPGNRFWRALHESGFTPRLFAPVEEFELLALGLGVTNFVTRATASAAELSTAELRAGARALEQKVRRYRPRVVAIVGITAHRAAFDRPKAQLGPQSEPLAAARLWVLPNTSGLNAHHQPTDLATRFRALRRATLARA